MSFTDYELKVLKILSDSKKNIYQTHRIIKKNGLRDIPYSTVQRAIVRLKKKGVVERVGEKVKKGALDAKEYKITLIGMLELYFTKRGKKDPLEFHRSIEAQDIIDKIIKNFLNNKNKKKEENLFLRTLRASPSGIEILANLGDIAKPITIKDPNFFLELLNRYDSAFPNLDIDINDEDNLHFYFLTTEVPLRLLAEDTKNYPNDKEIRRLFSIALNEKYNSERNDSCKERKEVFNEVLNAINNNIIDPKNPDKSEWEKFENYRKNKKKVNGKIKCWEHLYIYLPPMGEPRLVCDGKCKNQQR